MPTYTSPTYEYQYYQDSDDGGSFDSGGADPSSPDSSDMGFSTRYGGQIGQGMQATTRHLLVRWDL